MLLAPTYAVIISICVLFTLLYFKIPLAIALLTASLTLALLTLTPYTTLLAYVAVATRPVNIDIILTSAIIAMIAYLYRETKVITFLTNSLIAATRKVWITLTLIPAIFGLLVVPGGALMSAPLVYEISEKIGLERYKAAYINVWYRHLIVPVYPLSQLVILTAALSGFSITEIALYNLLYALIMYVVGFIPLYKDLRKSTAVSVSSLDGLRYILPLVVAVVVMVLGVNVVLSALLGLITLVVLTRPNYKVLLKSIFNREVAMISITTYAALSLREVITLSRFPEEFLRYFSTSQSTIIIPVIAVSVLLGFVIGIPIGAISITVPLMVSLTPEIKYVCLLLIFTYLGYIISPSHLCLLLTLRYFKTSLRDMYKYLLTSTIITLIFILTTYTLLL